MNEDKWIHSIKKKLSNHRMATPTTLWDKIDGQLSTSVIKIKRHHIYIAAAVATIAVILSLAIFAPFKTIKPESKILADKATYASEQLHIEPLSIDTKQQQQESNEPQQTHNNYTTQQHFTKNLTKITSQEDILTTTDEKTIITQAEPSLSEIPSNNHTNKPSVCQEHTWVDTNKPLKTYCLYNDSISNDCNDIILKKTNSHKTTSHRLIFAANTTYRQASITPFSFRCGEAEILFNHKMPLNVKVLFEKQFGKWNIGTGASYTYMTANYNITYNLRNGRQELHYIGIPLYVGYEFAKINRFSFYTSLGGQIDFNTQAIHSENSNSHAYPCIENIEFRDKKPQLSAQLHVGAACEIVPHLDLYIEPTLGYYFDNGSRIHSAWHDQPWNISLSFGLRTRF